MPGIFFGEEFSWGDRNIAEKAKYYYPYFKSVKNLEPGKGTGRSTDWISWGINHHMVLVTKQIANLVSGLIKP